MAKAKTVKLQCEECGAAFEAHTRKSKFCHAHAHKRPLAEDDTGGRTWVPYAKVKLADRVDQWLFAHDASNECEHGSLPHDRKIPDGCRCWGKRYPFEEKELIKAPTKKRPKNVKAA